MTDDQNFFGKFTNLKQPRCFINSSMAKEGGGCHPPPPPPNRFFQFFSGMERAFLQAKFLAVGSSVHEKIFQIGPTFLALKLDKGRVLGVATTPPPYGLFLTYFANHENDIQS